MTAEPPGRPQSPQPARKPAPRKAGSGQHRRTAAPVVLPARTGPGKDERRAEAEARASRAAAAAERRRRKRRNTITSYGAVGLVILIVAGFVVYRASFQKVDAGSGLSAADPAVVNQITSVPVPVLDRVGDGGVAPGFYLLAGNPGPLTVGGKPRVMYVGALYCPFCATQRWPVIAALSRFGSFKGLQFARSAVKGETVQNINTFSFSGVTYTSTAVAFSPYETQDRNHKSLDAPSSPDSTLLSTYDATPTLPQGASAGTIPFLDLGNRWVLSGASYEASELEGRTWSQIASDATSGTGAGQRLDGTANWLTAGICTITGNQPASVCSDPMIAGLQARLPVQ